MEQQKLVEFFRGTLDVDSSRSVEEWISMSDENRKVAENLYVLMFLDERVKAAGEVDVDKEFSEFRKKLQCGKSVHNSRIIPVWVRAVAAAAALIVAFLGGGYLSVSKIEKSIQPIVASTKVGERSRITLPDGSKVWLNAYSTLKYSESYFPHRRNVVLQGEAYFEVKHNTSAPFLVTVGSAEIKVVGTKFNVRYNHDESYLTATLMEGAITFSSREKQMSSTLKPGEQVIYDRNGQQFYKRKLKNPSETFGWVDGKLLFENTSFEEIALSLERQYNVKIKFADEKARHLKFNGEFEMADNIFNILGILELTKKFSYKFDNREIIISSK